MTLTVLREYFPKASLSAIDHKDIHFEKLTNFEIAAYRLNIEKDKLPFADGELDFVIANQVLEHIKELFWINHEVFRVLKPGGFFFIGVPNGLAFHNRILGNFGFHPTCNKSVSAHVRIFSKRDIYLFYQFIGKNFCEIQGFYGSQFYPFPKKLCAASFNIVPKSFHLNFLLGKEGERV